jgi:hypothetical protein
MGILRFCGLKGSNQSGLHRLSLDLSFSAVKKYDANPHYRSTIVEKSCGSRDSAEIIVKSHSFSIVHDCDLFWYAIDWRGASSRGIRSATDTISVWYDTIKDCS